MTQGTIIERLKRLRQSPMSHRGIAIMALLLVAIGTGIPLYGHLNQQKSESTVELLEAGDRALKAYRLTTPPEDNAFSHYQKVIERDSDNTHAKAGITKIAETYARLSRKEINNKNYQLARVYLQRGTEVKPGHATWPKLNYELRKLELSQQVESAQGKFKNFWQSLKK